MFSVKLMYNIIDCSKLILNMIEAALLYGLIPV